MTDFYSDATDSPLSDNMSCSTQSSLATPPRGGIEGLRRKLKLTQITSEKFSFLNRQCDSNDELSSAKGIKSSTIKKKFQDLYTSLETIGRGSCGIVKRVQCLENDEIYAAKIVKGHHQNTIEQLKREYQILSKLQHKNIISARELLVDEVTGDAQLIIEYFPGKTLEELIQERGQLDEELVRHITEQLVSALKHVHDRGVCHRDIKPDNILVGENYEVKLIDFSISKIFRQELWSPLPKNSASLRKKSSPLLPGYHNFMLTNIGTDYYKAPEVVTSVPYNNSVDMWSLGVVTFYCLVGYRPFQSKSIQKLYSRISNAEYKWDQVLWSNISYEATLFVKACLTQLPFIRLSTKEAMYHPWIKGIKINVPEEPRKDRRGRTKHMSPPARTIRRTQEVGTSQPRKSFVLDITLIN